MLEGLIKSWKWVKVDENFDESKNPRYIVSCPKVTSDELDLSDETYGKRSELYFRCKTLESAEKALKVLTDAGLRRFINLDWAGSDRRTFSMHVTYFKGHHYYE